MKVRGFTLIELMITVAIISILAAVAYPSYRSYVDKGRRAEARVMMLEAAQWMERFYAENYCYNKNTKGVDVTDASLFAGRFAKSPKSGTTQYTIGLEGFGAPACATTYTVVATRAGAMSADKCGDFTINHLGARSVKNYSTTAYGSEAAAATDCWK
jgi:type IV pilus assembly protein PilE